MRFMPIRRFCRLALFSILAQFALLPVSLILAQQNPTSSQPTSAPTTTSAPTDSAPTTPTPTSAKAPELPTVESIQSRIKLIQEQTGLDEGTKTKIIETYNQAIADLGRAEEWGARIAEFEKQKQEAPGTIEEMTKIAADPIPEPDIKPAPDAKLTALEKELAEAEAKFKTLSGRLASLESELKDREERLKAIADQIAKERKELDDVTNALANPTIADELPERAAAKRVAWVARAHSLGKELDGLRVDLERSDFLAALKEYTAYETAKQEKLVKAWQSIVHERRRAEVEAAAEKAKEAEKVAEQSHEVVAQLARENSELVERRKVIVNKIEQLAQRRKDVEKELDEITDRQVTTRKRVDSAGLSPQMAMVLRRYRLQLQSVRELRRRLTDIQQEFKEGADQIVSIEEMREAAKDFDTQLLQWSQQVERELPQKRREAIKAEVKELLKTRKKYVNDLWADFSKYLEQLGGTGGLVDLHQELLKTTESFAAFINERVFWARSTTIPNARDIESGKAAFRWLTKPKNWRLVRDTFVDSVSLHTFESGISALFILVIIGIQPRVRTALRVKGEAVSKSYAAVFAPTLEAFLLTIVAAFPLPLLMWTVSWFINLPYDVADFPRAFARSLQIFAMPIFAIEVLRQTCRSNGLGEAHYHWPTKIVRLIKRSCWLLIVVGLPLGLISAMVEWAAVDHWQRSLGRLTFCLGELLMSFLLWRVFRPETGVLTEIPFIKKGGWKARVGLIAFTVLVLTPLTLAVLSFFGFHFTAMEIAIRFNRTLWLLFGLIIIYGLGLRWLLISRRKLAIEQARQRRAALEAKQMADAEQAASDESAVTSPELRATESPPEPEIDISSLNDQTRAILRAFAVLGFALVSWAVWVDVIPALKIFDNVELWPAKMNFSNTVQGEDGQPKIVTGEKFVWITLTDLFVGILCIFISVISVRNLPGLLEIGVYRRLSLGAGERYAITTIIKYIITFFGVVLAFNSIGIGWAEVQWLAAAMTVGLGFGLQEIFANFVSGLILLFERPIRVGDIVTVNGIDGRVTRIQMRATTIMNWDRKELIIPNKEFVTGQVINWTLTDEVLRIVIDVGVAYGSDTRQVRDMLLKIATEHKNVMKDPSPRVVFKGFGTSTLDFQLRVFVQETDDLVDTGDEINYAIDDAFRAANIEIAFPQMDIHLRDVPRDMRDAPDPKTSLGV